jgi:hypothetical protein
MRFPKATRAGSIASIVLAALTFGTVACNGHPVSKKLDGRWHGESVENVEGEVLAAATGWAKGASFEFAGSALTVAIPAEEPRSASYEVVRVRKDDVRLAVKRNDGRVDHLDLKLDDDRSLRWMLGDGRAVVMRREL